MCAVIDILATEIPDLQPCLCATRNNHTAHLDAVGGVPVLVEGHARQPLGDLRLAHLAIAEQ